MIEITGNRMLISWLAISFIGVVGWLLGYITRGDPSRMISVPRWILLLCGIRHETQIDHKKMSAQLFSFCLIMWSTILTIFVANENLWDKFFGIGFLLDIICLVVFETVMDVLLNKRFRGGK